jgi:hypothetical protein
LSIKFVNTSEGENAQYSGNNTKIVLQKHERTSRYSEGEVTEIVRG